MEVSMIKISWSKRILFFFPCTWVSLISFVTLDLFLHPALHLIFERSLDWLPSLREEVFAEPEEITANRISGDFSGEFHSTSFNKSSWCIVKKDIVCMPIHWKIEDPSTGTTPSSSFGTGTIRIWPGFALSRLIFFESFWCFPFFYLVWFAYYISFLFEDFYLKIKKWQNFVKMILCLMNKENQMMDKIIKMMEIQ